MNKIRKGDQVIVTTGRDKGKRGTVSLRVDEDRIVVDGVNVAKKHTKPNPLKGTTGGVVDKTMPIHQSNVAIWNPTTGTWSSLPARLELQALAFGPLVHPAQRGAQLSVLAHGKGRGLFDALTERGVIADWREPNVIRIAPVPMYNSFEDVYRFGTILKDALT